ncbi:hypothetical protein Cus16_0337 [Curtobacterium sp. ER1/6]|nr:hypothetical protein Cus16_0337 [Curtobacterium sp. ER1/6]
MFSWSGSGRSAADEPTNRSTPGRVGRAPLPRRAGASPPGVGGGR